MRRGREPCGVPTPLSLNRRLLAAGLYDHRTGSAGVVLPAGAGIAALACIAGLLSVGDSVETADLPRGQLGELGGLAAGGRIDHHRGAGDRFGLGCSDKDAFGSISSGRDIGDRKDGQQVKNLHSLLLGFVGEGFADKPYSSPYPFGCKASSQFFSLGGMRGLVGNSKRGCFVGEVGGCGGVSDLDAHLPGAGVEGTHAPWAFRSFEEPSGGVCALLPDCGP